MEKSVLITGGAGSLGVALCKELLKDKTIKHIVIFSRNEKNQLSMKWELKDERIKYVVGDVKDFNSIYNALIGIDQVYHLAAIKHIDIAEENPIETANVNVLGTINVINASIQNRVKKVLFVSTDKASSPTGIYGASKLMAEKNILLSNGISKTKLSVVRFGNLIGSSGSIFEKWSKGGKIFLTHKNVTRFFIKMEDAAKYCAGFMRALEGNEIFIPKMKSARIYDIAQNLSDDIEIVGLRKNEKVHEDIVSTIDSGTVINMDKYYKIVADGSPNNFTYDSLNNDHWFSMNEIEKFYNKELDKDYKI